eukprot:1160912-Pelagomonas_calceolata.AAC.7
MPPACAPPHERSPHLLHLATARRLPTDTCCLCSTLHARLIQAVVTPPAYPHHPSSHPHPNLQVLFNLAPFTEELLTLQAPQNHATGCATRESSGIGGGGESGGGGTGGQWAGGGDAVFGSSPLEVTEDGQRAAAVEAGGRHCMGMLDCNCTIAESCAKLQFCTALHMSKLPASPCVSLLHVGPPST